MTTDIMTATIGKINGFKFEPHTNDTIISNEISTKCGSRQTDPYIKVKSATAKGYEQATGEFVFHLDCDFFFSEYHFEDIREACEKNNDSPALSFWKYQFILPDRYNLKSRLVLGVNKAKYGDRIKFNSGGDLCQPSLDDNYISPDDVPEARVPFYNYEKLTKTKEQIAEDVQRMDRAYYRHFGKWLYSNNGIGAYEGWYAMAKGRFSKPQEFVNLVDHPKYIQRAIRKLTPEQFGYKIGRAHV